MDNNRVKINTDRARALGQWGGRHGFVNLAAMTYFWMAVVQGLTDFYSAKARSFIRHNPDVYRNLEKKQMNRLGHVLLGFSFSMVFTTDTYCLESIPRVPVLSDAGLLKVLSERGGTLTEISKRLGLDNSATSLIGVKRRLMELMDLGAVHAVHLKKSKVVGLLAYKKHFRNSRDSVLYFPRTPSKMPKGGNYASF